MAHGVLGTASMGCADWSTSVVAVVAPLGHHGFLGEGWRPASLLRPCIGYLLGAWPREPWGSGRCRAWYLMAALSTASMMYARPCIDRRSPLRSWSSWSRCPSSLSWECDVVMLGGLCDSQVDCALLHE